MHSASHQLKEDLARQYAEDSVAYTPAKTDFIQGIIDTVRDIVGLHRSNVWENEMSEERQISESSLHDKIFTKTVHIDAPVAKVWEALTVPALMQKWMTESEIDILTDWKVGSPILIQGVLHKIRFENRGRVLQYEPQKHLQYSHVSSLSRLPDDPESYSVLDFHLVAMNHQTALTVTVKRFPTEVIYRHLAFYWHVAPEILKKQLEVQT